MASLLPRLACAPHARVCVVSSLRTAALARKSGVRRVAAHAAADGGDTFGGWGELSDGATVSAPDAEPRRPRPPREDGERFERSDRGGGGYRGGGDRGGGRPPGYGDRRGGPISRGGGRSTNAQGFAVRPGDWEHCGINQFASREMCFKCGAARPEGAGPPAGYAGGRDRAPPEMKPGDWCAPELVLVRACCLARTPGRAAVPACCCVV
jgi:hypothetical protein